MSISNKVEERGGVLIIFFVAFLAAMVVVNNSFEKKIINSKNNEVSYSDWYNAKSIKQLMKESERDYLITLLDLGIAENERSTMLMEKIEITEGIIDKYEAEKAEILVGSAQTHPDDWAQDMDGQMGKIVGLQEWRKISERHINAVAKIDLGILFLQISIVFGVVGLLISDNIKLQKTFTWLMIASGFLGIILSLYGYTFSLG